ncbi:Crp/Fnr family transcriptional regulator [Flavivirga sp. 57AJ16]|uniref:Crp/Fnr family transcriptional regulator n=1 Tax=Flavivirga sp. 57AJ16 TaxID=3025307 RepID=UPI002366E6A6|nr:Crp/Fnr family transcriptional regulator [Flavivirga sp. 57AJ16]MDD7886186.1 Crp/Fnr family transcriptional regulator [Flavivirga sp. 57AJ16]
MNNLRKHIDSIIEIDEKDLLSFTSNFQKKSYLKNENILLPGEKNDCLMYINTGVVRVFYTDSEGKEITIHIGSEDMWVNNLYYFFTKRESILTIQAIEETVIYQIRRGDLEKAYTNQPVIETFIRLKLQRAFISLQERTLNQITSTAEERYLTFKQNYGDIETRVPQYVIASYLNITPEHLSKIRHRLLKN